jgi:hypothetical protein
MGCLRSCSLPSEFSPASPEVWPRSHTHSIATHTTRKHCSAAVLLHAPSATRPRCLPSPLAAYPYAAESLSSYLANAHDCCAIAATAWVTGEGSGHAPGHRHPTKAPRGSPISAASRS